MSLAVKLPVKVLESGGHCGNGPQLLWESSFLHSFVSYFSGENRGPRNYFKHRAYCSMQDKSKRLFLKYEVLTPKDS